MYATSLIQKATMAFLKEFHRMPTLVLVPDMLYSLYYEELGVGPGESQCTKYYLEPFLDTICIKPHDLDQITCLD